MLDTQTKRRIDDCRDILVGKLPDPKAQIEQITIGLIYKFMDDMDKEAIELGGQAKFFSDYKVPDPEFPNDRSKDKVVEFSKYTWSHLMSPKVTASEMLSLYSAAIEGMEKNPNIPQLFRDIFNNAYLPYRDPETLKLFLKTIGEFEYTHSEKLGDAFEYLLSVMGSQGDAGQFRTPRHIIDFLVSIIDPDKNHTILDPACGTAGFLISAYKHILLKNTRGAIDRRDKACLVSTMAMTPINIYQYNQLPDTKKFPLTGDLLTPDDRRKLIQNFTGYDISPDMVRLSLVNLYLHGFNTPNINEYDTLSSEDRWNETADVILANPPFMSPKGGIRPHKKFTISSNRSEVLFVDYIAEHLNLHGKAGVIVPEGIIFQSGTAYKELRKMLVDNYLYAVVSLPAGVFNPYSGVKTSILLMDKDVAKKRNEILFIKIDNDGYNLGAQRTAVKGGQLEQAIQIIHDFAADGVVGTTHALSQWEPLSQMDGPSNDDTDGQTGDVGTRHALSLQYSLPLQPDGDGDGKSEAAEPTDNVRTTPNVGTRHALSQSDGPSNNETDDPTNDVGTTHALSQIQPLSQTEPPSQSDDVNPANDVETRHALSLPHALSLQQQQQQREHPQPQPPLHSIAHLVPKSQIAKNGDYNLSGERYKTTILGQTEFDLYELKELFEIKRGGSPRPIEKYFTEDPDGINWIKIGDVAEGEKYITATKQKIKPEGLSKTRLVEPGDFILTNSMSFGRPYIVGINGAIHDGWLVFKQKNENLNKDYIFNILSSDFVKVQFEQSATGGVVKNLNIDLVKNVKIPLPPLSIQEEIVAEIEGYQKIIDGAKAVVNNYKPKIDIDPDWEMVVLGGLAKNLDGKRIPITKSEREEGIYPYYGASGIVDYVANFIFDEDLLLISEDGANLIARVTPIAFSVSGKVWVNNHAHVLRFDKIETQKFVELYLNSISLEPFITGSAQPKLNQQALNSIPIPLPDKDTQHQIVSQIEKEQELVNASKQLIEIFEQKIRDRIAKVWGE